MTSLAVFLMATAFTAVSAQDDWYRDRRSSGYSGSSASSNTYSGAGFVGSLNAFSGIGGGEGYGMPGYGAPGYGAPGYVSPGYGYQGFDYADLMEGYQRAFMEFQANAQAAHEAAMRGYAGGQGGVGASASGNFGPGGGQGSARVYPEAGGGLDLRFGETTGPGPVNSVGGSIPAPGGGSFGVFTSSSSGQSTVDGQTRSFKTASVGVNDNGKVTTYTAHDP